MGVVGAAIKGFGKALAKGKKVRLRTVHKVKPDIYIQQFKKSKKHGLKEKFGVWSNREASKALTEAGSGITVKFKKSGRPYIPKSEQKTGVLKRSATRLKGWAKITSPVTAGVTTGTVHAKIKGKKK
jgi:hypothetical protein